MSRPSRWENQVNPGKVTFIVMKVTFIVWYVCMSRPSSRENHQKCTFIVMKVTFIVVDFHSLDFHSEGCMYVQVAGPKSMTFIMMDFRSLDFHSESVCMSSRAEQKCVNYEGPPFIVARPCQWMSLLMVMVHGK